MEFLTKLAGYPHRCAPSIHIAGSKGKGSVTGMLSAILTAAGYRTARYMSPHVIDIRERICLNDSYFDEDIYCSSGDELKNITEELLPHAVNSHHPPAHLFDKTTPDGCEPTFWELLTLLFFLCARKANCDVMVTETGMGGRLDSTNVLDPVVSVITLIELEHTGILGNTISAIAGEKAGIIKEGKPLVLAQQSDEALEVFRKKAQEKNSRLFYIPEKTEISKINICTQGTDFTLSLRETGCIKNRVLFTNISIPVPGKVQAENAALAIAAVRIAFPRISEEKIKEGLKNIKIPGRFEKITPSKGTEQPLLIIDGAHTPESLALCIETFCSLYGEGGILLFGCAADKDASAMAKKAHSLFSKIIITTPGNFKISNPASVFEAFASLTGYEKTILAEDTREAVKLALGFAEANKNEGKPLPILGTGSFYLVSEIRKIICAA